MRADLWGHRPARPGQARLGMTLEPLLGSTALYRTVAHRYPCMARQPCNVCVDWWSRALGKVLGVEPEVLSLKQVLISSAK